MDKQTPSTPNPEKSRGVYGFVLSMMFVLLIISYFSWLIIPTSITKTWAYEPPQKYWAVAVPIFFCTALVLFAFCIYPAMHSRHDGELHELSAIQDKFSIPSSRPLLEIPPFDEPLEASLLGGQEEEKEEERHEKVERIQTRSRSRKAKKQQLISSIKFTSPTTTQNDGKRGLKIEDLKLYDESNLSVNYFSKRQIPPAADLDISDVCKVLYLQK